jgi:hypothetical protein
MVFYLLPTVRFPNRARYLSHLLGSLGGVIRSKIQFKNAPIKKKKKNHASTFSRLYYLIPKTYQRFIVQPPAVGGVCVVTIVTA